MAHVARVKLIKFNWSWITYELKRVGLIPYGDGLGIEAGG